MLWGIWVRGRGRGRSEFVDGVGYVYHHVGVLGVWVIHLACSWRGIGYPKEWLVLPSEFQIRICFHIQFLILRIPRLPSQSTRHHTSETTNVPTKDPVHQPIDRHKDFVPPTHRARDIRTPPDNPRHVPLQFTTPLAAALEQRIPVTNVRQRAEIAVCEAL